MSFVNHHHHGKIPVGAKAIYKKEDCENHKKNMFKMYNEAWIPERERLLKQGADIVWYEDIPNTFDNVYFNNIKLEKVWSDYAS